ncbi:5240_t:CDS:10 [Scutellospora calospora]|uniref:5240_t:CDS:1 n=1 Tax=Scutellospora calospora TaxID=85575 RepID=A0ACA9JTV7_9GLOM|nr:5240_t:CDS:10 [Scutellospora calospora]
MKNSEQEFDRFWNLIIFYFYENTGTGKTNDYDGEEIILLDKYHKKIEWKDLMNLMNDSKYMVETEEGEFVPFPTKYIFITNRKSLEEAYELDAGDSDRFDKFENHIKYDNREYENEEIIDIGEKYVKNIKDEYPRCKELYKYKEDKIILSIRNSSTTTSRKPSTSMNRNSGTITSRKPNKCDIKYRSLWSDSEEIQTAKFSYDSENKCMVVGDTFEYIVGLYLKRNGLNPKIIKNYLIIEGLEIINTGKYSIFGDDGIDIWCRWEGIPLLVQCKFRSVCEFCKTKKRKCSYGYWKKDMIKDVKKFDDKLSEYKVDVFGIFVISEDILIYEEVNNMRFKNVMKVVNFSNELNYEIDILELEVAYRSIEATITDKIILSTDFYFKNLEKILYYLRQAYNITSLNDILSSHIAFTTEMSRLDYFAEKSTWNLLDFLEWGAANFKKDFGSKDEEHLTYKINLETIKNKPEILLFRDSFTVRKLATEALENFKVKKLYFSIFIMCYHEGCVNQSARMRLKVQRMSLAGCTCETIALRDFPLLLILPEEEVKSIEIKTFWENCPTFMISLTKVINLTSTRMVSRVSELHDDLSNAIYTETRDQISSFPKRKKTDSLQNNGKKLHLDKTENSHIMKEMGNTLKERNNIEDDSPDRKKLLPIKVETDKKKISIEKKIFGELLSRHIYLLCKPFRELCKEEAEELFNKIDSNTTVELDLSTNIIEYLQDLLSGDIKSALSKIEKPPNDESQLLLWVREVCRHFLLYYYHGGLQVDGSEKTWSTQTVYRILDLFSTFFGKTISGIAFGEIMNEAHNDRTYNINYSQKPSNYGCVSKNDAVLYQDEIAAVLYEQSFGPTEFTLNHQLEDFAKLAHNGVDDLNFHFNQNRNCTTNTAKKFKSIGIHGYKRWQLVNIAKFGAILEKLLIERQNIKEEMSKESILNNLETDYIYSWIKIPDNTPKSKNKN